MKLAPKRMDVVTRISFPKESLLRFVIIDGVLTLDKEQKKLCRGVYVAPSSMDDPRIEKCLSKAFKKNISKKMIEEAING